MPRAGTSVEQFPLAARPAFDRMCAKNIMHGRPSAFAVNPALKAGIVTIEKSSGAAMRSTCTVFCGGGNRASITLASVKFGFA